MQRLHGGAQSGGAGGVVFEDMEGQPFGRARTDTGQASEFFYELLHGARNDIHSGARMTRTTALWLRSSLVVRLGTPLSGTRLALYCIILRTPRATARAVPILRRHCASSRQRAAASG